MKHITTVTAAMAVGLALAAGPSSAQSDGPITLNLDTVATGDSMWVRLSEEMRQNVAERTDGAVDIVIRHSAATGGWREQVEGLDIGTTDIVLQSFGVLDRYVPLPGIEAFPFLIRDLDHFEKVYYGPVGQELYDEIERQSGFKLIGAAFRGARMVTSNVRVESMEDMQGLRIRVPPLRMYQQTWNLLGASGTGMAMVDVFVGLQQGIVDAQENPIETIHRWNLQEVQDYLIETAHVVSVYSYILNAERFNALPEEYRQIIQEEAEAAMKRGTEEVVALEEELRVVLADAGMEFIEIDQAPLRAAVAPLLEEFPDLAPWVERIQAVE